MSPITFRNVARKTSIRSSYKEQVIFSTGADKVRIHQKSCSRCIYERNQPRKKAVPSIMLKCDFYGPVDRPNRQIHGFDDITLYFSKEFLRFREDYLYVIS